LGFPRHGLRKRLYPLTVGAESACEVTAIGPGVTTCDRGDRVVPYAALTCGTCPACLKGRDNLCENVAGVRGFHIDGFAQDLTNHPARLLAKIPADVSFQDAACVAVAYATVEHMLFDNASWNPARPSWSMRAAPASAALPSASPNPSAAPSSPQSARPKRQKRPEHSGPITSSTTAKTGSRAWSAS